MPKTMAAIVPGPILLLYTRKTAANWPKSSSSVNLNKFQDVPVYVPTSGLHVNHGRNIRTSQTIRPRLRSAPSSSKLPDSGMHQLAGPALRSEERRVGKEC